MLIGVDASRAVAPRRTGTENYSLYLIRALVRVGAAHRFRLYMNRAPAEGLLPRDERVTWRVMPFPRLWTHVRLSWEMATHPPDVLFVPAHVLPLWRPRAAVATVHDLGFLRYPEAHTRASRAYLRWSTHFNAQHARVIVADSEATVLDLASHYGVAFCRMRVAYPAGTEGLAPVTDPKRLAAVRERYAGGAPYLLYLGTLQPRKNLSLLLRAFGLLLERGELPAGLRLVLAGKPGWLAEPILAEARALGERVVTPGFVAEEDLAAVLSAAEAFCFPSLYEGFGLPVLEAMACGTPVICARSSSLPEVAGDAAVLVDPHDPEAWAAAILRVCQDSALREDLARRGLARAAEFTWEACARIVLDALEDAGGYRPWRAGA